jgi:hypothetical protein
MGFWMNDNNFNFDELKQTKFEAEIAQSLLEQLLVESRLYRQSKDYKDLLDFVVRMRNFAPFNAMILQIQKPGLRFAASKFDWWHRFKRTVREGSRPLIILWPFGPIALVYDLDDTEGESLPDSVKHTFRADGKLPLNYINQFMPLLNKQGIILELIDFGDAHAGDVKAGKNDEGLMIGEQSKDVKKRPSYLIRINSNHDPNVQFVTLIHELAHLFLGHLGPDKYLKIVERRRPNHEIGELEAESVAYLVCHRNGVKSKSEEYLVNYVKANTTIRNLDLYMILKSAGQIETILELGDMVSFGPRKK